MQAAPQYAKAHVNLGIGLEALGDADAAVQCFEAARAADPGDPYASYNLGSHLYRRGELDRAERLFRTAMQSRPDFAEAHVMLANVLDARNDAAAAALLESAVRLKPELAGVLSRGRCELANALVQQGRLDAAVGRYREALRLRPGFLEAQYGLAAALRHLGRHDEATAAFEAAMRLAPDSARGWYLLANAFRDADRNREALDCLRRALALDPEYADARWALAVYQLPAVHAAAEAPQESRAAFSRELDSLDRWYDQARAAKGFENVGNVQPFLLAYHESDNRDLLQRYGGMCARLMGAWADGAGLPRPQRGPGAAVRVGVVSSFFSNHSVWSAIVKGWFGRLDPERVALHAFDLRGQQDDETRYARSRAASFESGPRELRAWAEAILRQRLDVLVYPEIGMDAMTLKLAGMRLAPAQVAAWGHPETTGLPTIDYYLSAAAFEPADAQSHYSERLVTLPGVGCCYSAMALQPAEPVGVDTDRPLLICPGAPFKYSPRHDALLVEIARRAGGARLVFFTFNVNPALSAKLRLRLAHAFHGAGLDLDEHVRFVPWQSGAAFYGLLQRATLYLDTIGFSGFNTAMHAVECALPIVTREGRFMRGRLASGILKRMGLGDLVAASDEDYVSLAVRLAGDAAYREQTRRRMRSTRGVLFEDMAPIRAMEDFFAGLARA